MGPEDIKGSIVYTADVMEDDDDGFCQGKATSIDKEFKASPEGEAGDLRLKVVRQPVARRAAKQVVALPWMPVLLLQPV